MRLGVLVVAAAGGAVVCGAVVALAYVAPRIVGWLLQAAADHQPVLAGLLAAALIMVLWRGWQEL